MRLINHSHLSPRSIELIGRARRTITRRFSWLILGIALGLWAIHLLQGETAPIYYLSFSFIILSALASIILHLLRLDEQSHAVLVAGLFLLAVGSVYTPMTPENMAVYLGTIGILWLLVALLSTLFLREWINHLLITILWVHSAVALPLLQPRELLSPLPYMILISICATVILFYLQHFLLQLIQRLVESKEQTDRSKQQLATALRQKETLLKEVHHRVKNNLQVISSLLNLHVEAAENQASAAVLQASQGRVRSMALVHEELYQSEELSSVNIQDYVRDLIRIIELSFRPADLELQTELEIEKIYLDPDTVLPLGLVLNELLTNIYKHAFAGLKSSKLLVRIIKIGDEIRITLRDWGNGLPEGHSLEAPSSMGSILISSLTEQLAGTIELIPAPEGTEARISFPYSASPRTEEELLERLS